MNEIELALTDDMVWSFSRLKAYEQCPREWYRKYIEMDKEKAENAFSQHGSFTHELIQSSLLGERDAFELAAIYENEYDDHVTERFPFKKMGDAYYESTLNFLNEYTGDEWRSWEVVGCEIPVQTDICGYKVVGFIDLLLKRRDTYLVVDFKSKSTFKNKQELHDYARQLYIYALWVQKTYSSTPLMEFYLYRGKDKKHIEVPYTDAEMQEMKQWVSDTIDKIKADNEFQENPDEFYCDALCDYRCSCPMSKSYSQDERELQMKFGIKR